MRTGSLSRWLKVASQRWGEGSWPRSWFRAPPRFSTRRQGCRTRGNGPVRGGQRERTSGSRPHGSRTSRSGGSQFDPLPPGGGGLGRGGLCDCQQNGRRDALELRQHLPIGEADGAEPVHFQPSLTDTICSPVARVLVTVQLDDEAVTQAHEVHDIGAERLLPTKLEVREAVCTQCVPEDSLRIGRSTTERSCHSRAGQGGPPIPTARTPCASRVPCRLGRWTGGRLWRCSRRGRRSGARARCRRRPRGGRRGGRRRGGAPPPSR